MSEPSGLLIGEGVKILGISLERRRRTPAALPLIADGNSVVWTARLFCFAQFPLEGRKTSIVSIQTCHVQREGRNPLNSWPLCAGYRRHWKGPSSGSAGAHPGGSEVWVRVASTTEQGQDRGEDSRHFLTVNRGVLYPWLTRWHRFSESRGCSDCVSGTVLETGLLGC